MSLVRWRDRNFRVRRLVVSGVFGIAGGMIMLGVLLIFFDVPTAMVLFSLLAATGNAWRVVSWWRHVNWRILWGYAAGGVIAVRADGLRRFRAQQGDGLSDPRPDSRTAIELLPRDHHPNIEWRGVPFLSGLATTAIQLVAGNGGLLLDVFFQKSIARPQDHGRHQGHLRHRRQLWREWLISAPSPGSTKRSRYGRSFRRRCWRSPAPWWRPTFSSA